MYIQAAIKPNTLLRNGAYGIVMRGVQKCTRGCSSLRGRKRLPLCCIKLDTATDPAAGSGNFLTESYLSIRRLENEVVYELTNGQMFMGYEDFTPIKVNISQFYGIEINDFAVTVARTALWIAENQMMKATEDIIKLPLNFLPLKTNAHIVEGNALRIDWNNVVDKNELNYIMGNPPFVGHQWRSKSQNDDMKITFYDLKKHGKLDYVAAWYHKAADFIQNTKVITAFVSTNSIVQSYPRAKGEDRADR